MSPRSTLRAVAALFLVAGLFLLRLATFDPSPRDDVERIPGLLAQVEFRATPERGECCVLTLTSGPTTFALYEGLQHDPTLRSELAARLVPGVAVVLECPREGGGAKASAAGAGPPRRIYRLSANGALICDVHARRGHGQGLLHIALGLAAFLALGGGVHALLLAGRCAESGRSA